MKRNVCTLKQINLISSKTKLTRYVMVIISFMYFDTIVIIERIKKNSEK